MDQAQIHSALGEPPFPPIRIDEEGVWSHRGQVIDHRAILNELKRHLKRDGHGRYWVDLAPVPVPVNVDLVPYQVLRFWISPVPELVLDDDSRVPLAEVSGFATDDRHRLFCRVKQGREWAIFSRAAHQWMEPFITESSGCYFFELAGRRLPIEPGGPEPAPRHADP